MHACPAEQTPSPSAHVTAPEQLQAKPSVAYELWQLHDGGDGGGGDGGGEGGSGEGGGSGGDVMVHTEYFS